VSPAAARDVYGVVADGHVVDAAATTQFRQEARTARAGTTVHLPQGASEWTPALRLTEDAIRCSICDAWLCERQGNWKLNAATRTTPLHERLAELHITVRPTTLPALCLAEHACRRCGTLLETEILIDGDDPVWDVRLVDAPEIPTDAQAI
jgi:hypothetical protein